MYVLISATQEEAAAAYDVAAIEYRGINAVTNFDLSRYSKWQRPINQNNVNNPQQNPNCDANPIQNLDQKIELDFIPHQPSSNVNETEETDPARSSGTGGSASSALGLLLQSSKFKEIMERTSAADSPSTPHPSTPPESDRDPPRRSFPDYIQTSFHCQEYSSSYIDGDDIDIFRELNPFAPPILHYEFDGNEMAFGTNKSNILTI